jgi:ribonuclease E
MNYFERLVRRALLRPASTPGKALDDPFATVAQWPLETPAPKPPPAVTPAETTVAAIELASVGTPSRKERPLIARDAPPPIRSADEAPPTQRPAASSPLVDTPREVALAEPAADAALLAATEIEPKSDALATADAFMRSLGAKSQLPEPATPRQLEAVTSPTNVVPAQTKQPEPAPSSAQIVSPAARPLALPVRPVARAARKFDAPPRAERREAAREQTVRTRTVVETRQILVERGAGGSGAEPSVSGGGSPRFGLGQL